MKLLNFRKKSCTNDFPSDGLVLIYDDVAYGQSLGRTSKFPRDSFAFKWADEIEEDGICVRLNGAHREPG